MITYNQMVEWHNKKSMHLHQNFFEFCDWLNVLERLQPKVGLEIGTYFFGSSQMALEALPNLEKLVTVDIVDRWPDHKHKIEPYGDRIKFICGDSKKPQIKEVIEKFAPFDFLFIDGDHSYEGVASDFRLYSGLVRKGGVIGLHDVSLRGVARNNIHTQLGCEKLWEELEEQLPDRTEMILTDPGPWGNYGIGIVKC